MWRQSAPAGGAGPGHPEAADPAPRRRPLQGRGSRPAEGLRPGEALRAVLLAAAAALVLPALAAGADAQGAEGMQCPAAALGEGCVYHVARTLDVGDMLPSIVKVDPDTGKLYVASRPYAGSDDAGHSYVRIYDSEDRGHRLIAEFRFNGTNSRVPDLEANPRTGELHVVHLWGVGDYTEGWTETATDSKGRANLTTIDLRTNRVVGTVQLQHIEIPADGGSGASVDRYDIADLALDRARDRAYIATAEGPILAVDTSGTALLPTTVDHGAGDNSWNAYMQGAPASALAVDEEGWVHAAVRVGSPSDKDSHSWGIARLKFTTGDVNRPTAHYTRDFFFNGTQNNASETDHNIYPDSAKVRAESIHLYGNRSSLFVLYENHTVHRHPLDLSGDPGPPEPLSITDGPPEILSAEFLSAAPADYPPGGNRIGGIALDDRRGLLYASVHDWDDPHVIVANAENGSVVGVASTADQTGGLGLDPRTGSVYVLPSWAPHAYVIESKAKHGLQSMIDTADHGGTVAVPAGIYDDVVLDVDKPLTLTSETGRPGAAIFTGNSRITVASDDVTIRGVSFEGTDCLPGFGGALVEIRTPRSEPLRGVAIENNAFRDTCHAAIQQKGSGSLEDVTIRYNSFEGIGLKIPLGRAEPADTGGEGGFQLMHGAIGLAYHHSQGHVGGIIEHNRINGTSAAGIRVFNATDMKILNNHISNTPASAIGLAHASSSVMVANNTIVNANSEPDLDYLDGIDGSGEDGYYKIMGRYRQYLQTPLLSNSSIAPAPDAAINVWANGRGIEVTGNTISGSDGAFTACTGLCAFESTGPVRAAQQCTDAETGQWKPWQECLRGEKTANRTNDRNILRPDDSDASTIRFSGNIIYADNTGEDNDGVLVRYDAIADKAVLDATGNFFVGFGSGPNAEQHTSGLVNISGRGQTAHGNASGPSGGVEYRITRTFAIDDIRADFIEVGPNGGSIYVGINPAVGAKSNTSAVHAYTLDYEKAGSYEIPGPVGRIVDMEVDGATGNLHVLHRKHDINQTTWQLGVTTLNGSASVVGMPWMVSGAMYSHYHAASADMAVGGGMVFVTNMRSNEPVAVLDGSTLRPLDLSGAERAAAAEAAGRIAGIAVDARDGHTLAYLATQKDDGTTWITTVNFSSAGGGTFQNYTLVGSVQASSGSVGVRDMVVDGGENKKLFVLWDYQRLPPGSRIAINQTVSMYDILDGGLEAMGTLDGARPVEGFVMHGDGVSSIALDKNRSVLHAVVHDSTDPRMVSYDSSDGSVIRTTSLSDQPAAVAAAGESGTVYASPSWRPNVYVIERAQAHPLQGMIDSAPYGGVVEVPPGTYADAVLTIDKPLVLTSPTGRAGPVELTGLSRIHVESDGVAIRGLSFRDTACLPGMAASLVEIGMRPGNHSTDESMRSDVTVENSAFANTCHAAIQQEGWGRMDNIVIRDNRFEGIGLRLEGGRAEPIDTDGEDEFIHTHGAIGLAYHPGQDPVSNSVITGNTILGTSAAGIRVFNADNVAITNNYIRDTPASGIGLSHGSVDSHVSGNTIMGANSEPDFDYLDGISGSGEDDYYRLITRQYDYELEIRLTTQTEPLAPDAAVKVWANSANVSVTGNTILGSGGAFTACAGTCASESDGLVHPGERNVLDPARYDVGSPANRIAFNWNVVAGDNDLDNSSLLANDASGELDAAWNHYPGHTIEGAQLRSSSTVNISESATRVVDVAAPSPPPDAALETGDSLSIGVALSRNVTVDTDSGKRPTLALNSGGTAMYLGTLQNKIMFAYTVGAGEAADRLDYASHDALRLNGATIDGMPGPLALTLPPPGEPGSLGASSDLSVNRKLRAVIGELGGGGGSATIPADVYKDAVITVAAPGNLTAEPGAVLTGNSRVIVEQGVAGPVVLTGLAFRGTACYADGGAALVVRAPPGGAAAPVVIRDGTFDGTCSAAIDVLPAATTGGPESSPDPARHGPGQQGGAPPIRSQDAQDAPAAAPASRILITGNTFRGVGAGAPDAAGSTAAIRLGLPGAASGAAHVENSIVSSNYVFDSPGPAVEAAAARGVDIVGNHIEGAGSAAVRVINGSSNVSVAGNTIINASGAALEVWADSSGVVIMGNRISESRGALSVCSGECALTAAADGARMRVEPAPQAPQAPQAVRFHYNILHDSNRGGMLVENGAPAGLLNASYNHYPGYAPMPANFTNASYAPPMPNGTAPHRVGSLLALTDMPYLDGVGSAAALREAVERFGLERIESGAPASIELVQADLRLADPLAAVRGIADGIDDDRNYPILHNQILWMRGMLDAGGREASISAVRALDSPQEHYPFILDRDGRVLANGANPARFGVISPIASAPNPVPFADVVRNLEAEPNSTAWRNYPIPNFVREGTPIESKRSLLALYDFGDGNSTNDLILGAGYYPHPVKLAVGPSDGPSIRLAKGLAEERGLVLASPGSTEADLALPDTVYRMVPNDLRGEQRLADVMASDVDNGIRRVVALVQDDVDGNRAYDLIKAEFEARSGGTVLPAIRLGATIAPDIRASVMNDASRAIVAASAGPGGSSAVAVLYIGSDSNYIDVAAEAAGRPAMHSVRWYSTDLAGSRAVIENRTALDMAQRTSLTAVAFAVAPNEHTAAVDAAIEAHPHAADYAAAAVAAATQPGRVYAAYDAVRLLGSALAGGSADNASFAAALHGLAAGHSGALGRGIAFDANGDLVRPSNFSTWTVSNDTHEWVAQPPVGPPPDPVCSAELARGTLPLGDVQVGSESAPQEQTVMNTGSLPLVGVLMNAGDWSSGLPAGVTSFRAGGGTGAFAPITPNASVLAQGESVMPGLGLVVEHRVDLRGTQSAPSGPMSQAVTYAVSCR